MSYKPYGKQIDPLCPLAVRLHQTAVHAPAHETWGIVTCDGCKEEFFLGLNRIHGSRISPQGCAQRLEALLAEDHMRSRAHQDSYEIPD